MMFANGPVDGAATFKVGDVLPVKCTKGSAFHSQDLVAKQIAKGPNATDAERFGNVDVRCMGNDVWNPSSLPNCSGIIYSTVVKI
jgi:hypothetical protein